MCCFTLQHAYAYSPIWKYTTITEFQMITIVKKKLSGSMIQNNKAGKRGPEDFTKEHKTINSERT